MQNYAKAPFMNLNNAKAASFDAKTPIILIQIMQKHTFLIQKNAKAIVFACFCIRTKVFFESKGDFTFLMQNYAKTLGFGNKNAIAHVFDPKGCKSIK